MTKRIVIGVAVLVTGAMLYLWGHSDGRVGRAPGFLSVLAGIRRQHGGRLVADRALPGTRGLFPWHRDAGVR